MFKNIELPTFQVEAVTQDYLLRADMQPRGDMLGYLNDRNWQFISFRNGELQSLAADRRVGAMPQDITTVNKQRLTVLSVLKKDQAADIHLQITTKPSVFYFDHFAVQGKLHVPPDAPDEDLLDEMHDFYPVSDAVLFPIRPVAINPTKEVPLLFVNRSMIQTYHVLKQG
jgi:hypothetical protein